MPGKRPLPLPEIYSLQFLEDYLSPIPGNLFFPILGKRPFPILAGGRGEGHQDDVSMHVF